MKKQAGKTLATRVEKTARQPPAVVTRIDGSLRATKQRTTHALKAPTLPPELEHLAVLEREDYQQSITDEGGAENIIRRRAQSLENRARVQRRIRQIDFALDRFGVSDGKGRLRQQWIDKLISLVGMATRIEIALGFGRRAKRVPTPDEWIPDHQTERG